MSSQRWLLVGLGNPGPEYSGTRHNVGHLVVQELTARAGGSWRAHKSRRADVVETRLGGLPGVPVVLARPRSYMNNIGPATAAVAGYYQIPPERVVAIHDELDLPFGVLRLKLGGGDNGHNGVRSLRGSLGSGDFYRVRVGIGRPPAAQDPADYVLSGFSGAERKELPAVVDRAADAAETLVVDGLEQAQQLFNG